MITDQANTDVAEEATETEVTQVEAPAESAAPAEEAAVEAKEDAVEESAAAPATDAEATGDEEAEEPAFVNPNWRWYVVHTYSGYENRAKQCLLDRIQNEGVEEEFGEILIPTENVTEVKGGAKRTTTKKFFPGYILVQMELTDETWHVVKSTQKITGFVGGTARRPTPIPDREVRRITEQMEDGVARPKPTQTFEDGQQVRVIDGPFLNFTGTVEEVRPEKQKLRVLVSIFGRATPVELDYSQVERV